MQKFLLLFITLFSLPSLAFEGFHFEYKDWEIACDNFGTCRMAGYGDSDVSYPDPEGDPSTPVSLLFIREMLASRIEGFVKVEVAEHKRETFQRDKLELWLDGIYLGPLSWKEEFVFQLSEDQIEAMLWELSGMPEIEIRSPEKRWFVSPKGSTAMMAKMDEFQQRVGTPTAFLNKGEKEYIPLEEIRWPIIRKVNSPIEKEETLREIDPDYQRKLAFLKSQTTDKECFALGTEGNFIQTLQISPAYKLINSICSMGNSTTFLFVLTDIAEQQVFWRSTDYQRYENGELIGSHKREGEGNCWFNKRAVWNGETFERSAESTNGQCRGFPDGAWELPTFRSKVVER